MYESAAKYAIIQVSFYSQENSCHSFSFFGLRSLNRLHSCWMTCNWESRKQLDVTGGLSLCHQDLSLKTWIYWIITIYMYTTTKVVITYFYFVVVWLVDFCGKLNVPLMDTDVLEEIRVKAVRLSMNIPNLIVLTFVKKTKQLLIVKKWVLMLTWEWIICKTERRCTSLWWIENIKKGERKWADHSTTTF